MAFIKKGDVIVIIITLLIGAGMLPLLFAGTPGASTAQVWIDGELFQTLRLDRDGDFPVSRGDIDMTVTVKDGAVAVTHSNCRDKICVHMGYVSRGGRSIICLPNRVVVKTQDGGDAPDAVIG